MSSSPKADLEATLVRPNQVNDQVNVPHYWCPMYSLYQRNEGSSKPRALSKLWQEKALKPEHRVIDYLLAYLLKSKLPSMNS